VAARKKVTPKPKRKKVVVRQSSESKRQQRGASAQTVVADAAFKEALQWVADAAILRFRRSKTPADAWAARLDLQSAEDFATVLVTYIKDGQAAAKAMEKEKGKLKTYELGSDKEFEEYLKKARKARAEFDEMMKTPTPEASDGHV
jgi:hypothetical protein